MALFQHKPSNKTNDSTLATTKKALNTTHFFANYYDESSVHISTTTELFNMTHLSKNNHNETSIFSTTAELLNVTQLPKNTTENSIFTTETTIHMRAGLPAIGIAKPTFTASPVLEFENDFKNVSTCSLCCLL